MPSAMSANVARPWYRESWTWFLIAGPAIVIVAGIITVWLAVRSDDGLVSDDYYKEGLAVNRSLAREARALSLGVSATLRFAPGQDKLRLTLLGQGTPPPSLRLQLVHPTLAGYDQTLILQRIAPGLYETQSLRPLRAPMRLQLESAEGGWRISALWTGEGHTVLLSPRQWGEPT